MADPKPFRSHDEQLEVLQRRGLWVDDEHRALDWLRRVNYYRLSGYWYPLRRSGPDGRSDAFAEGARFEDVTALYEFDERLRTAVFAAMAPVELAVRALLGHSLGRLDACAHLRPEILGPVARTGADYERWRARHENDVASSREEFVDHHRRAYDGVLPVWAAVELLDWGGLVRLLTFAPQSVLDAVADDFGLRAPQLVSWLRALNIVRNACAHHGRLFNRVYPKRPRLPDAGRSPDLDRIRPVTNRTFGQLTLVQYLRAEVGVGRSALLTRVIETYPSIPLVPIESIGAVDGWRSSSLWT